MNINLKRAISRLRKTQDAIFNGKCTTKGASIEITVHATHDELDFPFFGVGAFKRDDLNKISCQSCYLHDDDTVDEIETALASISQFLDYNI